ncbi:MAG: GDP-mannose 4,6-dehydratase [Chloroflexi bacterium]|nr:GDP-mannose 4,6-dehydratase [Chloroflexota bacterium]
MPRLVQRIVVTGRAGFIGSHLIGRLLHTRTADIVILDNLSRGRLANIAQHRANPRLQFIEGDVRDAAVVRKNDHGIPQRRPGDSQLAIASAPPLSRTGADCLLSFTGVHRGGFGEEDHGDPGSLPSDGRRVYCRTRG